METFYFSISPLKGKFDFLIFFALIFFLFLPRGFVSSLDVSKASLEGGWRNMGEWKLSIYGGRRCSSADLGGSRRQSPQSLVPLLLGSFIAVVNESQIK